MNTGRGYTGGMASQDQSLNRLAFLFGYTASPSRS